MRAPIMLRERARAHRNARQAAAIATGVHLALNERQDKGEPVGFAPTSGWSTIETASGRWMPHDHRPIIGFTRDTPTNGG